MPPYKPRQQGQKTERPRKIAEYMVKKPTEEKEFLVQARERFKLAVDAESKWREESLDDLRFLTGKQWHQEDIQARKSTNRPTLTVNRLPAIKRQLVNEQRAQRPGIVVRPVGNGADQDGATMLEGLIRHIEVQSDVEIADDTAFEHMVTGGKGYVEVCADYLPGQTFDQELYIRMKKNPFTIYCDPSSELPDESDAEWKFEICDYPKTEYRAQFPGTDLASLIDFMSIGDQFPQWGDSKTIRVAKYWHKEYTPDKLYRLSDGQIITKSIYDIRYKGVDEKDRLTIAAERDWRKTKIVCSIMNAIEVIEEYNFPGNVGYIPLIPCLGEDFDVNGERYLAGIVREAKDPQRSINYFRSATAETICLAPKAPWVGWKGQFKDPKWALSNTHNFAYLEAEVVTTEGSPAPSLPQRNVAEPPIQGMLALSQVIDGDLKAVTGIYEPSLGQNKGDQSGSAIDKLQSQSQLTNLNFTDNLTRMKRAVGRVLLDAAPFIYDAPRIQRIINPDGSADQVILHNGRSGAADKIKTDEVQEVYDLSMGSYDVVIDVAPSFKTRRMEAFRYQTQLMQSDKSGMIEKAGLDIIVSNSDMPGSRELAARIRKLMPPNLLSDDKGDPKLALQQAQSTIQQLEQQNMAVMKQNQEMMTTIREEKISAAKDIQVAEIRKSATIEAAAITAKTDLVRLEFEKFALLHEAAKSRAESAVGAIPPAGGAGDGSEGEPAAPPPAPAAAPAGEGAQL